MATRSGYLSEDTISAISTETGGAICVVRVSGCDSFRVLRQITRSEQSASSEPRKLNRAQLYLADGEALDDALFARFVSPHSYSGEDLVEFHVHGGQYIAHRLMESLISYGVRQALPGEFSFRAVRNGKMNLFQAQAVSDLISASNDTAISLALEKMSGAQNSLLQGLSSQLRKIAVLGEIGIDFVDQDVEEVGLPHLRAQVSSTLSLLEKIRGTYTRGLRLQEGIRVAFIGLPNAGKSSFFNALLGEDRSIVSEIAGTTRDVIREKLTLRSKSGSITLRLEDTAGLRKAQDPIEKIGVERSHQTLQEADLILFLVDPTDAFEGVQDQWANLKSSTPCNGLIEEKTIGLITKVDLLSPQQLSDFLPRLQSLGIQSWVKTSALTDFGVKEGVEAIVTFCERWSQRDKGELILTRVDHFLAVQTALQHLERAKAAPEIDLFASDIRQALHALGPLIGDTLPDDILGKIFSDFCIGK